MVQQMSARAKLAALAVFDVSFSFGIAKLFKMLPSVVSVKARYPHVPIIMPSVAQTPKEARETLVHRSLVGFCNEPAMINDEC